MQENDMKESNRQAARCIQRLQWRYPLIPVQTMQGMADRIKQATKQAAKQQERTT